ncbi:hypothetical protein C8F01DRAFT_1378162 [Mycena amicta]|nr:hypothetical protein C8F01DRAFT_1378162 [Mycena amicta]
MATPEEAKPTTEDVAAKPDPPTTTESKSVDPSATTTPTAELESSGAATMTETTTSPAAEPVPATQPEPEPESLSAPRQREMVADARLGVLRAMFPDFDDSLLQSVLESVDGNTDLAIDSLLGMSDPDYQSERQQAPPPGPRAPQSQEELDAQLARSLAMEDEREQAAAWPPQQHRQGRPEPTRRTSEGPEKDTMQEITEQFNKIAESGKRTIGTLFSKVKAKIQELDQPAGPSNIAGYGNPNENAYTHEPRQAAPTPAAGRHAQQAYYQQQRKAQEQAQMPAYYDPNASATEHTPSAGYDAEPVSMPSPPSTNAGAPQIDAGKLGMLPKRPVSLLRTSPPPAGTAGGAPPSSDDDGELEYAENPFEDGPKK